MPRIDDLPDAEFMKLQAEYGDSLAVTMNIGTLVLTNYGPPSGV